MTNDHKKKEVYLEQDEYNIEKILDMKINKNKKYYFVKWEGFPSSDNTWEPIEHLEKIMPIVEAFEKEFSRREKKDKRTDLELISSEQSHSDPKKQEKKAGNESQEYKVKKLKLNSGEEVVQRKESLESKDNLQKGGEGNKTHEAKTKQKKKKVALNSEEQEETYVLKSRVQQLETSDDPAGEKEPITQPLRLQIMKVKSHDKTRKENHTGKPTEDFQLKAGGMKLKAVKKKKDGSLFFLMDWSIREDGYQPPSSYISNEDMKKHFPDFLFAFYESRTVNVGKAKNQEKEI